jgi:hypothetical protein
VVRDLSETWDAIKTAVELVAAALVALFSFVKLGTDALRGIQQLPDLRAQHRVEELQRNQEQARNIVLLVGIEAAYYLAKAGRLVAAYAVQAAAMTKFVLGILSLVRSGSGDEIADQLRGQ